MRRAIIDFYDNDISKLYFIDGSDMTYSEFVSHVSNIFKSNRYSMRLSKSDLGKAVGKGDIQIQRYESSDISQHQFPNLYNVREIARLLDINPFELLALKLKTAVEYSIDHGIVFRYKISNDGCRLYWKCEQCKNDNVTYYDDDAFDIFDDSNIVGLVYKSINTNYWCEHCNSYYSKLYRWRYV